MRPRDFAKGLGPTPWEFLGFLAWLAFVIASMTAMLRVPPFNLIFWPTLWIYDLWKEIRRQNAHDSEPKIQTRQAGVARSLWDRELDG